MKISKKELAIIGFFPVLICAIMLLMSSCASNDKPVPRAKSVDLDQFMGRWYVHGFTPLLVDKEAHNAIEHYRLDEDQKIQTTYQFRDGGYDAEIKTYTPVGWVHDKDSNSEWRMQFIWPFRSEYIIMHVDDAYSETIVVHPNRKYAWIMLRAQEVSEEDYQRLIAMLGEAGYDLSMIQKVPQDWSGEADRLKDLLSEGL